MSLWTEIINAALIGCERKSLSLNPRADKLGGLLAQLDQNDREGALLGASVLVSHYERAGALPLKDSQPLPEACDADDAPRCGDRAATHLALMLRGEYQEHLQEWLAEAAAAGRRAPEELLPQLLELGRMREWLREEIAQALGARGRWLQSQNPSWNFVIGEIDETLWETGRLDQRMGFIGALRKKDPARARELLESSWEKESPKDRSSFLSMFKKGLSRDDEAFLEWTLDDKRKEVRQEAADLLARLPGSALRQRMFERARPLLTFKLSRLKRKEIEVKLPEKLDKSMQRDGVEPKPAHRAIGEKAWWLQQTLGSIPPKVWSQESAWPISALIEAAKRSDWKDVLLDGWSQAAARSADAEWADALLAETFEQTDAVYLFYVLPPARQESFIIELLKKHPSLHTTKPAYKYIRSCRRQWGEALSRAVIDILLRHPSTAGSDNVWWPVFTNDIGRLIDQSLIPETISRFTSATNPPAQRAPAIEQFLNFIQFRHEMLKEIKQ
ncbi:MAG TPA: DUF5691 domain-containing protein [Blastocatellia bacterium]|nr:DUF5691 domain-containing protein [Blastocatellia bacterium]